MCKYNLLNIRRSETKGSVRGPTYSRLRIKLYVMWSCGVVTLHHINNSVLFIAWISWWARRVANPPREACLASSSVIALVRAKTSRRDPAPASLPLSLTLSCKILYTWITNKPDLCLVYGVWLTTTQLRDLYSTDGNNKIISQNSNTQWHNNSRLISAFCA